MLSHVITIGQCSQRKCHFLMIRERRKGGDSSSTPKQSKKQSRAPKEEEGLVQTRPHPIATSRAAALMQRRTTRRIKGKSAVQLRWQVSLKLCTVAPMDLARV